jgi:hypothetical protein
LREGVLVVSWEEIQNICKNACKAIKCSRQKLIILSTDLKVSAQHSISTNIIRNMFIIKLLSVTRPKEFASSGMQTSNRIR